MSEIEKSHPRQKAKVGPVKKVGVRPPGDQQTLSGRQH